MATFERSSQHVLSCLKQVCGFKVPELQPVTRFKGFLSCQAVFGWLSLPDCYNQVWDNPMTAISCSHVLAYINLFSHRALLWSLVYCCDCSVMSMICFLLANLCVAWFGFTCKSYLMNCAIWLLAHVASLQSSWVHVWEGLGTRLVVLGYFSLGPGTVLSRRYSF